MKQILFLIFFHSPLDYQLLTGRGTLTLFLGSSECGFEADEEGTSVIDHLNFDVADAGKHTLIVADPDNLIKSAPIVGTSKIAPILYEVCGILFWALYFFISATLWKKNYCPLYSALKWDQIFKWFREVKTTTPAKRELEFFSFKVECSIIFCSVLLSMILLSELCLILMKKWQAGQEFSHHWTKSLP